MKFFIFAVLSVLSLTGCSKPSDYQFACGTPIGEIMISKETDTNISLNDGILRASRAGKSIAIPFSQCVGLKDSK